VQETRLWNEERGETASMRRKESAQDYRYFPDPDLPPLVVHEEFVDDLRRQLPELPLARRERYRGVLGLPDYDVGVLSAHREFGDFFEALAEASGDAKAASNWMMTDVTHALHERGIGIATFPIAPARLAGLVQARLQGKLNNQAAKKVFARMLDTDEDAPTAIRALGLEQITDPAELGSLVEAAIEADPGSVESVQSGKLKALDALKGRVMQATRGRADPRVVDELLRDRLGVREVH
jgi:aspartyl-tRNA(Asn)/glutamyl-tRNA(Gln) amidotransferase subunit B